MKFAAPCAVRDDAPAKIDPSTRIQVNHDLFYVSRAEYLEKIRDKPLKYCKRLTDPVTREVFRPTKKSPRTDFDGTMYFFSSDSTRAVFTAMPAMYSIPPESMRRARPDSSAAGATGAAAKDSSAAGDSAAAH